MKPQLATFAQRLRWAREQRGLSQGALGQKAGVSQGAIGNYETGMRDAPRDVLKLAEALGVSPKWLLKGVGSHQASASPPPPPAPPADFQDRHVVTESEWALLQDIKDAMESPKLANQIDEIRAELAGLKKIGATVYRRQLEAAQGGHMGGMPGFGDLDEPPKPPKGKK